MHTSPASRRQAKHARKVFAPGKMVTPRLLSRMKERYSALREWVYSCDLRVFGTVTSLTGEGKVIQRVVAALLAWVDMFNAEGLSSETGGAAAILAEAKGAFRYLCPLLRCDALWHPDPLHPQLVKHLIE